MSAMLHLVGFAPERTDQTALLSRVCNPGDTLVLLDAGAAFARAKALDELRALVPEGRVLLLAEPSSASDLEALDHSGLVALTETHRGPASWY